jgi:hypothetical protein
MLFWRRARVAPTGDGEAWIYSNGDKRYALGTSLCYWRDAWERNPFEALPKVRGGMGEDSKFVRDLCTVSFTSCPGLEELPRMIASVHGSNYGDYSRMDKDPVFWKRVPTWDAHCQSIMEAQ